MAHSYLFWGYGNGKLEFALELAKFLEQGTGPLIDCLLLSQPEVGIDEVRQIRKFLWQRPLKSSRRTVIIDKAENLSLHARPALLKITEEPPSTSLIILIVNEPGVLPPALVSRFQKIYLPGKMELERLLPEAKEFLQATAAARRQILKQINDSQEPELLDSFIKSLFWELDKEPIKNFPVLKELSSRWVLINQFNLNKKLQLEAVWSRI